MIKKNNHNLLEKLTIIIPSYERQNFLIRKIKYWSNKNVKLIVIDGSKKCLDLNIIEKFPENLKYFHQPISFYDRMHKVSDLIETEFVIQACDDEFYVPSALNSSINELIKNKDLLTCGGICMGFNYEGNKVIGFDQYKGLKNVKLISSNPNERIEKHFKNYLPSHMYSVTRSKIWKIASKSTFSKEYSFYAALELQLEFLLTYGGKSYILPELMWLRSKENKPIRGDTPSFTHKNTLKNWLNNKKFFLEKNDFVLRMELACKQIDEVNNLYNQPNVIDGLKYYIDSFEKSKKNFFSPIISLVKKFPMIENKLRKLTGKELIKKDMIEIAQGYSEKNIKVDFDELTNIRFIINKFHK